MKTIALNENTHIPIFGFGTSQLKGAMCIDAIAEALRIGYRLIDTADMYGNHAEVAKGILESGIPREEIFLTTKVFRDSLAHDAMLSTSDRLLRELETEYVDLLLIHWPNSTVPIEETLCAMNELKEKGTIRAIGVSNFTQQHLDDALKTGFEITNNQVEANPLFNQKELRAYCIEKGISITAYYPLGRGHVLDTPLLVELAGKYNATPAQISLSWIRARDMIAIPKSTHAERMKENFDSLTLEMDEEDLASIDTLPQGSRGIDPGFGEFNY